MTYLAVPIRSQTLEEAVEQIRLAVSAGAEMLELRSDYLAGLKVQHVRKFVGAARQYAEKLKIIFTCRDEREGGNRVYSLEHRISVLKEAIAAGVDFVDCELQNFERIEVQEKIRRAMSKGFKGRLVLSAHNFQGPFDDIRRLKRRIEMIYPSAIPKMVYKARHINDCFDCLDMLDRSSEDQIVLAMGEAGMITRILAKKLGSLVTFASLDEQNTTASGQVSIGEMKNLYGYDRITTETQLYGIIGDPVAQSKSPAVHNACFEAGGFDKIYLPLHIEGGKNEFDAFMKSVTARRWLNLGGVSVTIPHKLNALEFVSSKGGKIDELAEKIGAVNTIVVTADGNMRAYNTDYNGSMDALRKGLGIKSKGSGAMKGIKAAVVGAGGVAHAVVAGLVDAGAEVTIYNRTVSKAKELAGKFGCKSGGLKEMAEAGGDLLVNCTSVGMYPNVDESIWPADKHSEGMAVFDTVGTPTETKLLRDAAAAGAKTVSGVNMFVNQAVEQFRLFTNTEPDRKLMTKTISQLKWTGETER